MTEKHRTTNSRMALNYRSHVTEGWDPPGPPDGIYYPEFNDEGTVIADKIFDESFAGDDLSGFRQVIKQGGNATNAAIGQRLRLSSGHFSAKWQAWVNPYWPPRGIHTEELSGDVLISFEPSLPGAIASVDNIALSKFISKANSQISPFQGGIFLGELRETIHMIRHPADGLKSVFSSYLGAAKKARRGLKRAKPATKSKALANMWLESSFGWRPFVSDLQSGLKALKRLSEHPPSQTRVSGYGSGEDEVTAFSDQLSSGPLNVGRSQRVTDRTQVTYFGAVRNQITSGGNYSATSSLGGTLNQFLPTVWELIPYSFLVDYFTNIGKIVEAASFVSSNLSYWGRSSRNSRIFTSEVIGDASDKTDAAYITSSVSGGKSTMVVKTFTRDNVPSLIPGLEFKLPLSGIRLGNIAALVAQSRSMRPY